MSKKKITDEKLRKLVFLIPARYFYEGVVTSDKARNYQDYIDIQCQTYRKTKSRKD